MSIDHVTDVARALVANLSNDIALVARGPELLAVAQTEAFRIVTNNQLERDESLMPFVYESDRRRLRALMRRAQRRRPRDVDSDSFAAVAASTSLETDETRSATGLTGPQLPTTTAIASQTALAAAAAAGCPHAVDAAANNDAEVLYSESEEDNSVRLRLQVTSQAHVSKALAAARARVQWYQVSRFDHRVSFFGPNSSFLYSVVCEIARKNI